MLSEQFKCCFCLNLKQTDKEVDEMLKNFIAVNSFRNSMKIVYG